MVLAVIVLAVFAYFRFFELKQPSTEEAKRQAQNVVNFERAKIDGVVIQNGDDKIEMRRRDNKWRLETPIKDQADRSVIENLLSDLENWQKDATISAKEIEADTPSQAIKQGNTQIVFQPGDGLTEGRLRNQQFLCCAGHMLKTRYRAKIVQLKEVHWSPTFCAVNSL